MKEVVISSIFRDIGCRMSYDLLALTKNGSLYEIGKAKSANSKLSECILIKDDVPENLAIAEFFRNYLRSGNLKSKTKKNILTFIKELEDDSRLDNDFSKDNHELENAVQINTDYILGERNEDNNIVKKDENDNLYYNDIEKFIYNTSAYDIKKVANLVVESRIKKISPYKLSDRYQIPSGTIFTWYKNINELRILYTFYTMENDYVKQILSNYSNKDIVSFQKKLIEDITDETIISEEIKKIYIDLINESVNKVNELNDFHRLMKIRMIEKILQESSQYSKDFITSKKQEILDLVLKDSNILDIIIDNIELEI
ncbi:hypothetical protein [Paraclostridium sordellii]|uniref:hypothetical protein n=1 Tax=Paraclostridium sordellii TaxID=1505 RepID=UPI001F0666BC|nr:hypothetical protein [Paeniclostridium sordellii]MCH1965709.1 hypothetical protein [Paeniclostridium sordellii]